jgi:hypothetical protein
MDRWWNLETVLMGVTTMAELQYGTGAVVTSGVIESSIFGEIKMA